MPGDSSSYLLPRTRFPSARRGHACTLLIRHLPRHILCCTSPENTETASSANISRHHDPRAAARDDSVAGKLRQEALGAAQLNTKTASCLPRAKFSKHISHRHPEAHREKSLPERERYYRASSAVMLARAPWGEREIEEREKKASNRLEVTRSRFVREEEDPRSRAAAALRFFLFQKSPRGAVKSPRR